MEHSGTLLSIAQLAVALAGFASLISVIGRRQDDETRVVDSLRLRMMLEVAFRNAAFALLPLPFLHTAHTDPMLWRVSSGLYLVITIGHSAFRLRSAHGVGPFGARWLRVSTLTLVGMTLLASLANVLGLGGSNAFSLYLASLLFGLVAAGLFFLSVASSVFRVERH